MSAECAKRVEHEALATEREKQLKHTLQELHQHKNFLAKEKTCAEKLRGDMCMLQVCIFCGSNFIACAANAGTGEMMKCVVSTSISEFSLWG